MTAPTGMLQQPRPLLMILFVELWEQFDYYGVQGVLAVFFVRQLGFPQEQTFIAFGVFAVLAYDLISIGGYVGDYLLGTKRIIVLGTLVLAVGYSMIDMLLLKPDLIFIALGIIVVGNGLLKANPVGLLSKCYPPGGPQLDGAFTLFYMSINIGSSIALSLVPVIAGKFGYSVTYNLCGAGLTIALLVYIICRGMVEGTGSEPDFRPMNFNKLLYTSPGSVVTIFVYAWLIYDVEVADLVLIVLSIVVTIISFRQAFKLDRTRHNKVFVVFVLMLEVVVFYVLCAQMPMLLNFSAINSVHHEIPSLFINPVSLQAFNPFWVVLASPILAGIYAHLDNRDKDLLMSAKSTLGMFVYSLGFLTAAAVGMRFVDTQGLTSPWFIVLVYLFQNLGELFINALGLTMIAVLVPQHLMGFIFGVWFLTQTTTFLLDGYVTTSTVIPDDITDPFEALSVYTNVSGRTDLVTPGVAVVTLLTVPWLRRIIATPESH